MDGPWVYRLRDLGEPALADSSPVRRPTVPLLTRSAERHLGVIDTGSPVSVTSIGMLRRAGIDVESDPLMEVPLGLGGRFDRVPVFGLSLGLLSPDLSTIEEWSLQIACLRVWSFGFDVLLGQRGWFDTFTTTFGEDRFAVENRAAFDLRFRPGGTDSGSP